MVGMSSNGSDSSDEGAKSSDDEDSSLSEEEESSSECATTSDSKGVTKNDPGPITTNGVVNGDDDDDDDDEDESEVLPLVGNTIQMNGLINELIDGCSQSELREAEDKFRKAMIGNAQLDNEKAAAAYQVELYKDRLEELGEEYAQLQVIIKYFYII